MKQELLTENEALQLENISLKKQILTNMEQQIITDIARRIGKEPIEIIDVNFVTKEIQLKKDK